MVIAHTVKEALPCVLTVSKAGLGPRRFPCRSSQNGEEQKTGCSQSDGPAACCAGQCRLGRARQAWAEESPPDADRTEHAHDEASLKAAASGAFDRISNKAW